MAYLLGLDIGTTSIKAVLYDPEDGRLAGISTRPTPVVHTAEGWSQHPPEELWQTAAACLKELAAGRSIAGIAISSFAEAGLPVGEGGEPLYPIIAWYDQRTVPQAEWWKSQLSISELHAITGQRLSPTFGVNKWLWLRKNEPDVIKKMKRWLSVPDYILWRLTGETATDATIASRTMLFDQGRRQWSSRILGLAGLDPSMLPDVHPSGAPAGRVIQVAAAETGLAVGTACFLGGHDHLCAALAVGATRPGVVVDSMGTAESTLVTLDSFQSSPAMIAQGYACYAHVIPDQYVLKAGLHVAGGAIEWLVRLVSGGAAPARRDEPLPYAEIEREAEVGVGKRVGPLWLPHFIGSGTPEVDWDSRAALIGARLEDTPADLVRGLLESLAFWLQANLVEIEHLSGVAPSQLVLLGGANQLRLLGNLKAAITNLPVLRPDLPEASATGAALLAGLGAGVFKDAHNAVASLKYGETNIQPDPALVQWYAPIYQRVYLRLYPALREIWQEIKAIEAG
jgi:xylulokinase